MSNIKVKVIHKKITKEFERVGYVNLNQKYINLEKNLAELAYIFRNPCYETLRIIYMKDNMIVGQEAISSKIPNRVQIFTKDKTGRIKAERNFYKMKNRMERLNANGYYMVHNHPSGNAIASKQDLNTTETFNKNVKGFKGHLIVNSGTYAWIDIDKEGRAISKNNQKIIGYKEDKIDKIISKNAIYRTKIKSRMDLVYLMHHIKNSPNYSIGIIVDSQNKPTMILDIPNKFLNMSNEQVKGYFKNLSRLNGGSKVFFATQSVETYMKSLEHLKNGTFLDSIWYANKNNKTYICAAQDNIKNRKASLFDEKDIAEIEEQQEIQSKPEEEKINIVYKKVGEPPKLKKIKNTLEATQELVGKQIQVIPYNNMLLICNEEAKTLGKTPNVVFDLDYIAGDCFVVGDEYKNGTLKSLTPEQIEYAIRDLTKRSFKPREKNINSKEGKKKDEQR